jgi:hypothetical protein
MMATAGIGDGRYNSKTRSHKYQGEAKSEKEADVSEEWRDRYRK